MKNHFKKKNTRKTFLFLSWTTVSMQKVISITYVTEVLPWQQAKYSSSAPDKGTQDKCDAPHLGNSNSLVLLLRQNMLSLWGLLTHICGCAGKKVKDCT